MTASKRDRPFEWAPIGVDGSASRRTRCSDSGTALTALAQ
jgi:hypothetical protein